jgi:hypothetical protein
MTRNQFMKKYRITDEQLQEVEDEFVLTFPDSFTYVNGIGFDGLVMCFPFLVYATLYVLQVIPLKNKLETKEG